MSLIIGAFEVMDVEQTAKFRERIFLPKAAMQTLPVPGIGDILFLPSVFLTCTFSYPDSLMGCSPAKS